MHIVGICGAAGAGKDTAASYLCAHGWYKQFSFAQPLKSGLAAILGVDRAQVEDRVWREKKLPGIGRSPRELMQTLGTEWGRAQNPHFWVYMLERKLMQEKPERVVITDVRFINEAEFVREMGGMVLRVTRPTTQAVPKHVSESGVPDGLVDHVVANDRDPLALGQAVYQLVLTHAAQAARARGRPSQG